MSSKEADIIKNNLSRDIYGRPFSFLNCDEKYHVNTEYIGMQEMLRDVEDQDNWFNEQSI